MMASIQMYLGSEMQEGKRLGGIAYCEKCHGEIGRLDLDEIRYMLIDSTDSILCFDCEKSRWLKNREYTEGEKKSLLRLFQVEDLAQLPINASNCWTNELLRVRMQLIPTDGWCLWFPDPDKMVRLHNVRMTPNHVKSARQSFHLMPRMLKK